MDEMQSSPVERLKRHLIEHGSMSVADYMAWCLTKESSGYYRSGNPLGAAGDFVTAPEVSQIFGELVAIWGIAVWQNMGEPKSFTLAELGPGRGTLMQDALRAARAVPTFCQAAQIHLVETSSTLRVMQDRALAPLCEPKWHESLAAIPPEPLIVIANEFFDALPVEQHIYEEGSWHKRIVALNGSEKPAFARGRLSLPPVELLPSRGPNEGDILEYRPAASKLIGEISRF